MAYSVPLTAVSAAKLTATQWNASVRDNILALANPAAVRARRTTNQSINTGTHTAVQFDASDILDTAAIHDPAVNNSRFTVPAGWGGLWAMVGNVRFASNATGTRAVNILHQGATILVEDERAASGAGATTISVATQWPMAVGEYVELRSYQSSGGALNLEATSPTFPSFAMVWVGLG